jgi:hypothetical protein
VGIAGYIYIGSPYTHEDPSVVEERYRTARKISSDFYVRGIHVFSPITHWHEAAKVHELPTQAYDWREYDWAMLGNSRGLVVVKDAGWTNSVGLKLEIGWALNEFKIPVFYLDPKEPLDNFFNEMYLTPEHYDTYSMIKFICRPH